VTSAFQSVQIRTVSIVLYGNIHEPSPDEMGLDAMRDHFHAETSVEELLRIIFYLARRMPR
jgi:hypothetical protein